MSNKLSFVLSSIIFFNILLLLQGLLSENDLEPVMFGEYEFTYSDENLQYFPVQVNLFLKFFNKFISLF